MSTTEDYVGLILEDQLLDHLAIPENAKELRKQHFSGDWISQEDRDTRRVFEFVMEFIREHREAPTKDVLEYEFGITFSEPQAPLGYVLEEFRTRYRRKEAQRIVKAVARLTGPDPNEAVKVAFNEFSRVTKETLDRKMTTDSNDLEDMIDRYKSRVTNRTDIPTFGYGEIDKDLNGIEGLVFVIARPKRYKSWQLVQAGVMNQYVGKTVALASLEMPKEEMLDRYTCARACVSWTRFRHGTMTPEDLDAIRAAKEENEQHSAKVHIFRPPVGERSVEHMAMFAAEVGADVLLIDQLKWIESQRKVADGSRWREVEYICEDLKEAANNVMPIYCAAQFNREAANLTEMADLSKIGLSDAIGQTADLLLGIYASKEMLQSNIIQFGTIDSRNYQAVRYDLKVDLSKDSSFRVLKKLEDW